MLLDDGLTEHILVKLCSRWNPALDDIVRKDEKYEDMRNNIEIWMRHKDESEIKIANVITKPTIQEILSPTYEIGTEKKQVSFTQITWSQETQGTQRPV